MNKCGMKITLAAVQTEIITLLNVWVGFKSSVDCEAISDVEDQMGKKYKRQGEREGGREGGMLHSPTLLRLD